jgi:4Fe-4S ferredoxin
MANRAKGSPAACPPEAGKVVPRVERARCEGRAECEAVCPYDVFEVGRIQDDEFRSLPFVPRLKVRAHGMRTAYVVRPDACHACGLCVGACPEKALKLVPAG